MPGGAAIGTSMNVGFPGTFSRNGDCIIANRLVKSTDTNNVNFGDAVFLNGDATGGTFSDAVQLAGAATFAAFAGIAVREVKSAEVYSPAPTLGFYAPGTPCDVLERGSAIVQYHAFSSNPAPVAGGPVFLRIATNGAGTAIGQFESASDGGNTIALTNAKWQTGLLDANNNIELTLLSRQNP